MIISQTPVRISFAGGGTDVPAFYNDNGGCVVSTSIDKYIYVIIKKRFDKKIRIGYSKTEMVDSIDEIQHELVRECMRMVGIKNGVEISTMADIPSEGSGLGSSSAVTVGLLNAMYAYIGIQPDCQALAENACKIEIDILKKPIGKQDQYAAAYGGFNFIYFDKINIFAKRIPSSEILERRLMLFYTGIQKSNSEILERQLSDIKDNKILLLYMKTSAMNMYENICYKRIDRIDDFLISQWNWKKQLNCDISNPTVENMISIARSAGATGYKLCGAGGRGFLLVSADHEKHDAIRESLSDYQELPFKFGKFGSRIIFAN